MRNFLLFISYMLLSCSEESAVPQIHTKELSNEDYLFNLIYTKDSTETVAFKELIIKDGNTGKIKQKISLDAIEVNVNPISIFIDKDVNFDGYNDIGLINYNGNYNRSFSFWLFDEHNKSFKHYKELDSIYNPVFLKDQKVICSQWHIGSTDFYLEKYFWRNDSLILKERYEEYWTDTGRLSITKLIDDQYVKKDTLIADQYMSKMKCE